MQPANVDSFNSFDSFGRFGRFHDGFAKMLRFCLYKRSRECRYNICKEREMMLMDGYDARIYRGVMVIFFSRFSAVDSRILECHRDPVFK